MPIVVAFPSMSETELEAALEAKDESAGYIYKETISKVRMVTCSVLYSVLCWMMQKAQWTLILKVVLSCMVYGRWLGLIVQSCLMLTVCVHLLGNLNCFAVQNGLLYCDAASRKWLVIIVVLILLMMLEQRFSVIKKQSELYFTLLLCWLPFAVGKDRQQASSASLKRV